MSKYIIHPPIPPGSEPKPKFETPSVKDISISGLLDDGLLTLFRELQNLKHLSVKGKLAASDARDLRDHLKLLFELKDRENELLRGKTDEELLSEAAKILKDDDNK